MISSKPIPRKKRKSDDVDKTTNADTATTAAKVRAITIPKIEVTRITRSMQKKIKVEALSSLSNNNMKVEEQQYIQSNMLPVPDEVVSNQEGVNIRPITPNEVVSSHISSSNEEQLQKYYQERIKNTEKSHGTSSKVKIEPSMKKGKKQIKKKTSPHFDTKSKRSSSGTIRPTSSECQFVTDALAALHPEVVIPKKERQTLLESCGMRDDITDAIVSTMLSQNTTDANSKAAYRALKKAFPSWEEVASCDDITQIEACIKVAGLAKTRAERIQAMLRTVRAERGIASMNYIQDIPKDEDVKKELLRFKGLGPKTISCVLLFALGRPEFPVDTHVLRITKSMGWVGDKETREGAYAHLNKVVPNHLKLNLHCLLVQHGKCCHRCAARNRPQFPPKDGSMLHCPLVHVSKWGGSIPKLATPKEETVEIKFKIEET